MYRAVVGIGEVMRPGRDSPGSGSAQNHGAVPAVRFTTDSPGAVAADFGVLLFDDSRARFMRLFDAGSAGGSGAVREARSQSGEVAQIVN